ncbi:hypothetical protein [Ottowia testudinis]|uniref:PsiF repeat-containing protein n=1 Tax=Ottowia testudinis TaxID=2816950 RepID=A0A975H437_9BURK|nr:hypothetical protein [Ottowia testudinis]QTD45916.1 hypothetical protein J1M35_03090 [Ottowia testudinis]
MMKKLFALIALSGAFALPAAAQMSPAQTNLDQGAARMEARNARGGQLAPVSPEQATANALKRCANLPAMYKADCEARVKGQGQVSGSVIGGGLVKETVTTMPQSELDAMMKSHQPMAVPAPRN